MEEISRMRRTPCQDKASHKFKTGNRMMPEPENTKKKVNKALWELNLPWQQPH
jgi:hypothetical protein